MKVVEPRTFTDAILTSSTVPETDYPGWSAIVAYAESARVISAHRIFESLASGNLGNDPTTSLGHWFEVGATNRWAMFDEAVGSATRATGLIEVTFAPGAAIDTIGALDTDAVSMRVRVSTGGLAIYDETRGGTGDADRPASILFFDIPTDAAAIVTVTLEAPGEFGVGTLIMGTLADLGVTEAGPSVGINDFSRRTTDDFGVTSVLERSWAKRMTLRSMFPTDSVDEVQDRLAALRAKPSLWIGDEDYESLVIYGYFKEFSIDLAFETISYCSITVEGLTRAPQIVTVESPLAAFLTNESVTLPADSSGAITSYAGAAGRFVIFAGLEEVSDQFELSTLTNLQGLAIEYVGQDYAVTDGMDGLAGASVVIRAVGAGAYAGLTVDKQFSLATASGGASAKLLTVLSDRQTIAYNAAGTPTPLTQTTTLSVNKQNTAATVQWTLTDAAGIDRSPVTSFLSEETGDTVTMTEAQFAAARNSTSGVIVTATLTDGVTARDKISIVRVQEGAKGDEGDPGAPGAPGANGSSVAELTIYRSSASAPATPSGGSYDIATGVLTPPSGWSLLMPTSGTRWAASGYVAFMGTSGTATPTWLGVGGALTNGTNGTNGADGQSTDVIFRRSESQPATPVDSAGVPAGWYGATGDVPAGADPMWASFRTRATAASAWVHQTPKRVEGIDGSPGAPAIAYVQDATPGAPPHSNQVWYRPSTKEMFRWNGGAWERLLGDLASANLISSTAQIGSLVVVDAHIQNLTVGTSKIADNAVTRLAFTQTVSWIFLADNTITEVLALTVNKSETSTILDLVANIRIQSSNDIIGTIILYRDGVAIDQAPIRVTGSAGNDDAIIPFSFLDQTPGTGTRTYSIRFSRSALGGTHYCTSGTNIRVVEFRK